jgi:hypothetical protein
LNHVQIVDEQMMSGHPVDGVLDALDKDRGDAIAVFAESPDGRTGVGALAVRNVSGPTLFETVGQSWTDPAIVERSKAHMSDRVVWRFRYRSGPVMVAYPHGDVIYFALAGTLDELVELLGRLP